VGAGAGPHLDYDLELQRRTGKEVIAPAR